MEFLWMHIGIGVAQIANPSTRILKKYANSTIYEYACTLSAAAANCCTKMKAAHFIRGYDAIVCTSQREN